MASNIDDDCGDFVKVNVSNSKNNNQSFELKFAKDITIADLKNKLEIITGGNPGVMQLELYSNDLLVAKLADDSARLGSYPIRSGMRIHVIDNFTWFPEVPVDKLELTDEQYEQKGDTVRNFLKSNRMGKYNEEEMRQKEQQRLEKEEEERMRAELCVLGMRCKVTVPGKPTRLGTVLYNGPLDGKKGIFIGIKYDEPLGKNDGSMDGKYYFQCQPNYGGFVSPLAVTIGNFPPEEDFDLDNEI